VFNIAHPTLEAHASNTADHRLPDGMAPGEDQALVDIGLERLHVDLRAATRTPTASSPARRK
jgi:hypothetical protein